jgi:hypothetical protein
MEKLKDPARITKSSRRDPHGRRQLMRVNSTNVLNEGLRIGGKAKPLVPARLPAGTGGPPRERLGAYPGQAL